MATDPPPPRAVHVMAKPTGAICNLDCAYCFFLTKETLYPGSVFRMSDALLERYIRQLLEAHHSPDVTIPWQGGEPTLMGLDFFRRAVALADAYRKPGTTITHTIQTNGTLLTDEWCAFLHEHHFLVGISIDGPQPLHDYYRVDKGGHPTFEKVMRGLRLLQKHQVEYNVLTTVNSYNADYPLEVYRFLRDEASVDWIQFIPVVERINSDGRSLLQEGSAVTDRTVRPAQLGQFLIAIFDEWVRHDVGRVFIQTFEAAARSWMGLASGVCVFSPTCGTALALEHNGDLYSCDHFVEPNYLLGNITETSLTDLVGSERQRQFGQAKLTTLPRYCQTCAVRFACHAECPKNRFITTPDGEAGLNYLCDGYKAFFTHVDRPLRQLTALLRIGRPAEDVMQLIAEEERTQHSGTVNAAVAKVGRNERCPCGSGRKYKYCHGRAA
jgi:serine-type anaerobic sulfatase-maturating enzyme